MVRESAAESYVIGVDAGGTHTRVGCFGLDGSMRSSRVGPGGSPNHNHDAAQNVAATVAEALEAGGLLAENAVALGAGMAGIGADQPTGWDAEYFALPSLSCPRSIVNDAVIAHRGALMGEPGIIVVAGTGSMILAITADGSQIESGRFEHYAGGARHLVFDVMERVLLGTDEPADRAFVSEVLAYWGAEDLPDLRRILLELGQVDRNEIKRRYGTLAPLVTAAADTSPLADAAVRGLAAKTAAGAMLLAPLIDRDPAPVALAGALAIDDGFRSRLAVALDDAAETSAKIVAPALEPLGGAALMAYELAGISPDAELLDRLTEATAIGR